MKQILKLICAALLAQVLVGCATTSEESAQNSGPTDICHVCRYNNDLACVCVKVKDTTPKADYQGTTYYFCSQDCRTAFLKNPEKYLPKR
jgi:YHS domain-containing protein